MLITTPAIVLSGIKYGESSLIVRALTREAGLKSYYVPGVFGGKKGRMRPSFFQPLTVLELTGYHRNRGSLERIREMRPLFLCHSASTDVRKVACALCLSEVLGGCLTGEQADHGLYDYVERAVRWLDEKAFHPLFPAHFMWNLTAYLGFYPNTGRSNGGMFDLKEGTFVDKGSPLTAMDSEEVNLFLSLINCGPEQLVEIQFDPGQPRAQLLWVMKYFELQVQGFRIPRSLSVLKDVFR